MADTEQEPEFRFKRNEELAKRKYVEPFPTQDDFSKAEHRIWRELFDRQMKTLQNRAVDEFFTNQEELQLEREKVPDYAELNDYLKSMSGWQIVPVPGLIPAKYFFEHLANKRFPTTNWIRNRDQMDYLVEPDAFHDIFGHLPMLADPMFADYTEQYGKEAQKALKLSEESGIDVLANLTRVYWYTVEFGLARTDDGLRIYGAGIQSSKTESVYSLESPKPRRLEFDLERAMRTDYIYSDLQTNYFVIDSYEELLQDTRPKRLEEKYKIILENPYEFGPHDEVETDRIIPANERVRHFY